MRSVDDETVLEAVPGEQTEQRQSIVFCEPFGRAFSLQHKMFPRVKRREKREVGAAGAGVFGVGKLKGLCYFCHVLPPMKAANS